MLVLIVNRYKAENQGKRQSAKGKVQ